MHSRPTSWLRVALVFWWLGMAVGSHWPRLDLAGLIGFKNDDFTFGLDKWLHVTAYAGLAWLALAVSRGRYAGAVIPALVAWAAIDELTQAFIPGRTVWWSDFCASLIGIGIGAIVWGLGVGLTSHDGSFIGHGRVVAVLTMVSRVFGLVRDWSLAFVFGFSGVLDAFVIAFMIPNLFRRLFGEGALAAAFIPRYTKLREREEGTATRFAWRVVAACLLGLGVVCVMGVGVLVMLRSAASLDERGQEVARLTTVMIWYAPLVCASAIMGAVLQVRGRFGVPAASPIILSVGIVVGCFAVRGGWGIGITFVAWAVLAAGVVQTLVHAALMPKRTVASPGSGAMLAEARRELIAKWWPTLFGLAVFQLNVLADSLIALFFSGEVGQSMSFFGHEVAYPMLIGAPAVLGAAARLYEFPLGVFGIAVATAIYPALSAAADRTDAFRDLLRKGLRLTMFIGLPASVGLVLVREPLCATIYAPGGALDAEDSDRVAWVLAGYAPAVWAYSMNHVLTRAFYARDDTRTPVRVGMAMVAVNIALNLVLIWPLGAAGLAWSTALCAMAQSCVLLILVRRHAGDVLSGDVWRSWARTAAITVVMAGVVGLSLHVLDVDGSGRWWTLCGLLGASVLGAIMVCVGAGITRMPELRWVFRGR